MPGFDFRDWSLRALRARRSSSRALRSANFFACPMCHAPQARHRKLFSLSPWVWFAACFAYFLDGQHTLLVAGQRGRSFRRSLASIFKSPCFLFSRGVPSFLVMRAPPLPETPPGGARMTEGQTDIPEGRHRT